MRKFVAGVTLGLMGPVQADPLATAGVGLASCEKLARDLKPEQGFNHMANDAPPAR